MRKIPAAARAAIFILALAAPAAALAQANPGGGAIPAPTCQRTANALPAEQRAALAAAIRQNPGGQDLTVDHLCVIDAKSAVVALIDFNGLDSAVHVASFDGKQAVLRKVWSGAIDAASLLRPPGGPKLVFATQGARGRSFLRRVELLDLASGKSETLASGTVDPSGACAGKRLLRLAPRLADVNKDKQMDIVVEYEEVPCDQDKAVRRQEIFLADGPGYRRQ